MTTTAQMPLHIDAEPIAPPLAADRSNEKQWLAARRTGITGTDIAGILGMSKWNSPAGVYLDKIGERPGEAGDVEAMEWGVRLEPVVAQKFAEEHRELIVLDSPGVLANKQRPWQLVNVDRLVLADSVATRPLEVKTTDRFLAAEWDAETGEVPAAALLQVHHEIATVGSDGAWLAALIGGNRYVEMFIPRDDDLCQQITDAAERFWTEHVLKRVPPPMDGSPYTTKLLGRLYDVDPELIRVIDPNTWPDLRRRREHAKEAVQLAEYELNQVENEIRALLGEAEVAVIDGKQVASWKRNGTFRTTAFREEQPDLAQRYTRPLPDLDVDALKRDHPDIYAQYRARVLRVAKEK